MEACQGHALAIEMLTSLWLDQQSARELVVVVDGCTRIQD